MRRRHRWTTAIAAIGALSLVLSACDDTTDDDPTTDTTDDDTTDDAMDDDTTDDAMDDDAMAGDATALAIVVDTVTGPLNIPEDQRAGAVCVLASQFPRNSAIVWRARVLDGAGNELDDTQLESMQVVLADGQVFDMRFGPHPRDDPADFFWTTAFEIPVDYPTGTLGYDVIATATDGRTGEFRPFNVAPSLLTITDEVLETIEEEA